MRIAAVLLVAALAASTATVGCGRDTPAGPSSLLDGTWSGMYTRGTLPGTITLQLTQSGSGVTGTWSTDLEGTELDQAGSVGGTATGSMVALFLNPNGPLVCSSGQTLSGTLTMNGSFAGERLVGDYVVFECASVGTGRIDATRR